MAARIALCVDLVWSNRHLRCNDKINKRTAASFSCCRSPLHVRVATTTSRQPRLFIAVLKTVENSNIEKKLQFLWSVKVMTFRILSAARRRTWQPLKLIIRELFPQVWNDCYEISFTALDLYHWCRAPCYHCTSGCVTSVRGAVATADWSGSRYTATPQAISTFIWS